MNIEEQLTRLRSGAPPGIDRAVMLATGLADGYASFDSPVGAVAVCFNPHGVSAVTLLDQDIEERVSDLLGRRVFEATPPQGWAAQIVGAIERGTPGPLPIDWRRVTPFRRKVLEIAARIPHGEVRPYGWLAAQVGSPGATRAVGSTMANNPVPLIIPCHRVVRADGRIGNYSLGGPDRKWDLLVHEGADPAGLERLAERGVRYVASATTGIYCHPTCRNARRITDGRRIEIHDLAQAKRAGLRPCRVCKP